MRHGAKGLIASDSSYFFCLSNDVVDNFSMHIGQTEVASRVAIGELFVLNAELVKDGGVEVVDVDSVFDGVYAELIGGAIHETSFDTSASHEHGKTSMVVVPASLFLVFVFADLGVWSPAKFTAPDDEGFVEKATVFQVVKESCGGFVTVGTKSAMAVIIVAVSVPGLFAVVQVVDLYEADAGFTEATSQEATLRKLGAPVAFMNVLGFLGNIEHIRSLGLHGVGEFHCTDLGIEFGVLFSLFEMNLVEGVDEIELMTLLFSGKVRVVEIGNEFVHCHVTGVDSGGLVFSGKEAIGP